MNYDNPLFAAVKKILRRFTQETNQITGTAKENADSQVKQDWSVPVSHELHVSDATIDRIKSQSANEKRRERFKDRIETVTVGVIVLYTVFAGFQWYELNTQNLNQSAANIGSGATADRTLGQVQKTVNDTHKLADAAQRQAKAAEETLSETTKNFRVDQRAWITLYAAVIRPPPLDAPANTIPLQVVWGNTGHTPALDSKMTFGYLYRTEDYVSESNFSEAHTMMMNPNEKTTRAVYGPSSTGVSPPFYVPIPPTGRFVFVSGTETYVDVFGGRHQTTFCMKVVKVGQVFNLVFCNAHNSED